MTSIAKRAMSPTSRLIPLAAAVALVAAFWYWAPHWIHFSFDDLKSPDGGSLTDTQSSAIDMVKELNNYLVSTTALLLGGLGWYLSQYKTPTSKIVHAAFFASVGFVALALVYAGLTDVQLADELAQSSLALTPGRSSILYYLEIEVWACVIAAILMLAVFTNAVTKGKL
jgi:hypothetical protein